MGDSSLVDIRPAVAAALAEKQPVITITSSPFTHTLPKAAGKETVQAVLNAAKQLGVTLAIVAVRQGRMTVGLEPDELDTMIASGSPIRVTRRDLPWALSQRFNGGTTVSSSMFIAARAGIRLLVSGAIGAARPLDAGDKSPTEISADLVELMQTPVAVVSAGARSVANVAHTAQILETFRVPVIGYRSNLFPTFYMCVGKCTPSVTIDTTADVACMLNVHWKLGGTGAVIVQPTPQHLALSPDEILPALQVVESQAGSDAVTRQHLTPRLMERLNHLTHGKALRAYQGILLANTQLAAAIAVDMARTTS